MRFFTINAGDAKMSKFNKNIPLLDQFKYCHGINGTKNLRRSSPSLEETLVTKPLSSAYFKGQLIFGI